MKSTISSLFTISLMMVITMSCAKDVKKEKSPDIDASTESSKKANSLTLEEGNKKFAFELYSKLKDKDGNIFLSPYSVSSALAMTYGGAKNKTEKQMEKALCFPSEQKKVHDGFNKTDKLLELINEKGNVTVNVANSIWPAKNYKFLDDYVKLLKDKYEVVVSPQDFIKAAEEARININSWVEDKTNKKIVDLIGPGVLDELTKLVLVNAIYFKGDWEKQFKEENTQEVDFYAKKGTEKVQLMSMKSKFKYAEDNLAQIIEIPYKGNELSMVVALPKSKDSLSVLENSLSNEIVDVWEKAMSEKEIFLFLPKFKIEWGTEALDQPLKDLGMVDAFYGNADFSGMTGTKDLFIKTVLHKAFIEVNEEGAEAAAATAVVMARKSSAGPRPVFFRADHPFVFMIKENSTGTILFIGRLAKPN